MKNNIFNTLKSVSISLVLLGSVSCEKFIDTELPYNQIGNTEVFADVSSANAALAGLYAELWSSSMISGDATGGAAILGTYTDDLNCYSPYVQNGLVDIYNNVQIPSNTIIYNFWSRAYKHIYYANSIIKGVRESTSVSQANKDRLIGEATVIRSMLYFNLSQIFDDIPYTDTTDYVYNSQLKKMSKSQLMSYLENDLKGSISILHDQYSNQERIYINRKTAELLLAKVLMMDDKWSEAEILLSQIIQSPLYTWESDLSKVFIKTGKHILWQLKPANSTDATKEFIMFNFTTSLPTSFSLSEALVNSFETGDLRKQSWILATVINQKTYFRPMKYKNPVNANSTEDSVILRIEEAYLLYAECMAQQNKLPEAKAAVDKIRQRAGLSPLPFGLSKDGVIDKIMEESRHEFFAEMGHRFYDLKRFKKLTLLPLTKPSWKTFHSAFPIPEKELVINPNLNPQNFGY
ncbi:RagB/SusD family nutrient uptake outer membrane protein [Chryseobacterium shigense]|uniref:Starch-binding associating with outer membrane n=1 Tax=Chryseobacterium shigense TaxID=297244 RepID=A0A1N7I854_9FLAO|nr:RagB/SusD family nutrient uptake outer membrane protein [Chryseobacterium shigense]PQA96999.1 RagB/SusD family nutrient uptake outer membrane protein [Chryseobacterium shigense]SIS33254.1 Starch-binding associating with outer membrane [Chryseobacterium shigense]